MVAAVTEVVSSVVFSSFQLYLRRATPTSAVGGVPGKDACADAEDEASIFHPTYSQSSPIHCFIELPLASSEKPSVVLVDTDMSAAETTSKPSSCRASILPPSSTIPV